MTDIEIELQAFLGTELGASVAAEIGQDVTAQVFLAGALAQNGIHRDDFNSFFGDLLKPKQKETA
jgi:hypothetical protein